MYVTNLRSRSSAVIASCFSFAVLLAVSPSWAQLQILEPRFDNPRAVTAPIRRLRDDPDRPQWVERETHRGFEVGTNRGVVAASTSMNDARAVAAIVGETWQTMYQFADGFTEVHHHPNFGAMAIQVYIDNSPPKDPSIPQPVWNPVGLENRIELNVSEGRMDLAKQVPLLRAAVAYSFMRVGQFDQQLPEWVTDGFAQAAVLRHEGMAGIDAMANFPENAFRGDKMKRLRAASIRLENQPSRPEPSTSPALVSYAVFGNDGVRAPQFFNVLSRMLASRPANVNSPNQVMRDQPTLVGNDPTPIDELAQRWIPDFNEWTKDPDATVPQIASVGGDDPQLLAQERELFLILKLAQRLLVTQEELVQPKVMEYKVQQARRDRTRPRPVAQAANAETPAPAPAEVAVDPQLVAKQAKVKGIATIRDLLEAVNRRNEEQPWAIVDSDGGLLWSQNQQRLQQLMGDGERFRAVWEGNKWVWSTNMNDGRKIAGWIEPLKKDEPYLVARFAVHPAK